MRKRFPLGHSEKALAFRQRTNVQGRWRMDSRRTRLTQKRLELKFRNLRENWHSSVAQNRATFCGNETPIHCSYHRQEGGNMDIFVLKLHCHSQTHVSDGLRHYFPSCPIPPRTYFPPGGPESEKTTHHFCSFAGAV